MRKHKSFNDRKTERKRIMRAAAILLAVAAVIAVALITLHIWEESQQGEIVTPKPDKVTDTVVYDGKEYIKKKNIETLLVMGLDKYEGEESADSYNNNLQSDFLMLFVFDHNNLTYSALHINRDTMADIDVLGVGNTKVNTVNKQLALAHTYGDGGSGSCRNVLNAVSRLLNNTEIEHYLSVTMDAVPYINDKVGGVEVMVMDDFTGIDDTLVQGESVLLKGEHALTYVRTRYGMDDSTNSTRMVRQRQYLEALFAKAKAAVTEDEELIIEVAENLSDHIVTDYDLIEILTNLSDYEFKTIYSIEGDNILGENHIEFYPYEDSIESAIMQLFYTPAESN